LSDLVDFWAVKSVRKQIKNRIELNYFCAIVKGKVVPVLDYLSTNHEDVWGSGGIAPPFLTSALDGDVWSASCPGRFTPSEIVPGAHWIGGWMGPTTSLDTAERKIILPRRE
jgi:hypothetical protein